MASRTAVRDHEAGSQKFVSDDEQIICDLNARKKVMKVTGDMLKYSAMKDDNDDITFSDDGEGENQAALVKKLRERAKAAEEKAQEYLTGWQKERADLVNARKRDEEEKREFTKFAGERVILDVIPTLDSFDLAFANKDAWQKLPTEWTKGIEYIYSQLLNALENHGVKRLYPLHEKFDPNRDEALATIETENSADDNKILEVIQPGYSVNGKIVRTTKVKVGELKS
jgi:molecular chaperone GrpE